MIKKNEMKMSFSYVLKRGHYLYFLFYWLYGIFFDYKIAKMNLSKTFFNNSSQHYPVQSISYPYMKELIKNIAYNSNDVFVDVGCAWGRLIGYMLYKTDIKKFIGIEINADVASVAKKLSSIIQEC